MIPRVVCYQEIPGSDHHLLQNVNDPISLILNLNGHKQVYIPYKTVVSGGCLILMALFMCHDVHCMTMSTLLSVLRLLHGFTIITIIMLQLSTNGDTIH